MTIDILLPPSYLKVVREYIDVNKDPKLKKAVTMFFHSKVLEWIKNDKSYKSLSKHKTYLMSKKGIRLIYYFLKKMVQKGNTNWYDLKDQEKLMKDYLQYQLNKYF